MIAIMNSNMITLCKLCEKQSTKYNSPFYILFFYENLLTQYFVDKISITYNNYIKDNFQIIDNTF